MDQFIQDIVREAGEAIRPMFLKEGVKYTKKHEHDVVTEADLLSNKILLERIQKAYPDHGIISEEIPEKEWRTDCEYTWIIDPLDGTKMFAIGWPMFGVMAALKHGDEIELGAIYYPVTGELLFAKHGGGAWMNGERIHTSTRDRLEESFGCAALLFGRQWCDAEEVRRRLFCYAEAMINKTVRATQVWSIALYIKSVSEGKQDWLFSGGCWWDFAPAKVILEEAGCVVTNGDGGPLVPGEAKGIIAANPILHAEILKMFGLDPKK